MSTALKRMTWEEYLSFERKSPIKHEFFDGEVFAMAGASRSHNVIISNVGGQLWNALRGRPCEVYYNDMRVLCADGLTTYPDVMVACDPEFKDERDDTLLNPKLIVEVLSRTTELYDRGRKFKSYRMVDSLQDYILVSQERAQVEHFKRQADSDDWLLKTYDSMDQVIEITTLGALMSLSEIYAKIDFKRSEDEAVQELRDDA